MYTATIAGTKIPLSKTKVQWILKKLATFEIYAPNTSINRGLLTYDATVEIYFGEAKFLTGKLGVPSVEEVQIKVKGYETAGTMLRTTFEKDQGQDDTKIVVYSSVAANTILGDILSGTIFTIAECPTTAISVRFEYADKLTAVATVAKALGKDWWFDTSDECHIGDKGSNKGDIDFIVTTKRPTDYESIRNKITASAITEDGEQLTATAEDSASQSTYGVRDYAVTVRDVHDQSTLQTIANTILAEYKDPIVRVPTTVTAPYFFRKSLETGDTVHVVDARQEIDETGRIKGIKLTDGTVLLEVGTTVESLEELFADLGSEISIVERSRKACPYTCQVECQTTVQLGVFPVEAEDLSGSVGGVVADSTASMGYCRKAVSTDPSGQLVVGPQKSYPGGNYVIHYRLKVASNASSSIICQVYVWGTRGGTPQHLADRYLKGTDFAANNTWQTFALTAEIRNNDTDVTFTEVYFNTGITDLSCDSIGVVIQTPETVCGSAYTCEEACQQLCQGTGTCETVCQSACLTGAKCETDLQVCATSGNCQLACQQTCQGDAECEDTCQIECELGGLCESDYQVCGTSGVCQLTCQAAGTCQTMGETAHGLFDDDTKIQMAYPNIQFLDTIGDNYAVIVSSDSLKIRRLTPSLLDLMQFGSGSVVYALERLEMEDDLRFTTTGTRIQYDTDDMIGFDTNEIILFETQSDWSFVPRSSSYGHIGEIGRYWYFVYSQYLKYKNTPSSFGCPSIFSIAHSIDELLGLPHQNPTPPRKIKVRVKGLKPGHEVAYTVKDIIRERLGLEMAPIERTFVQKLLIKHDYDFTAAYEEAKTVFGEEFDTTGRVIKKLLEEQKRVDDEIDLDDLTEEYGQDVVDEALDILKWELHDTIEIEEVS